MKSYLLSILLLVLVGTVSIASPGLLFVQDDLIGQAVPDFTLKNISGQDVNLAKVRNGKKAIIFFWATWCPHCRKALHELTPRAQELKDKNIQLVLVDVGEKAKIVEEHLKKNQMDFDVLLDEQNVVSNKYDLIGVPTFYFVNEQGIIKNVRYEFPKNYERFF